MSSSCLCKTSMIINEKIYIYELNFKVVARLVITVLSKNGEKYFKHRIGHIVIR